jgi:peptide/nickel transport system substrate-binding protein
MDISDAIVEPLLRLDEENRALPVLLARMPDVVGDATVYRFELKPGIKFHDGSTLKASDVKYTFERMFMPDTGAEMSYICDMIVGAQDMLEGNADELAGFKIIDDLNFEISLSYPYTPFIQSIATSYAGIYPEAACKAAGKGWGVTSYLGTGPFKVTKLDLEGGISTERFEDYHGARQPLDGVEFVFVEDSNARLAEYERGNLDIMALDATLYPEYSQSPLSSEIGSFTPIGLIFLKPNVKDGRLSDVRVREALSLAIDRKAIADGLMKGTATEARTFLAPGMLGYDERAEQYERDVARAKELLAEAGYPDGIEIKGYIKSSDMDTMFGRVLSAVQSQAREAGIEVEIVQVDPSEMSGVRGEGKVSLEIYDWYADFPDPDGFIYSMLYSSNAASCSSNYDSGEFDKLLDDARSADDEVLRAELYFRADQLATRVDYAALPLFHENLYYLCKPYVKNFKMVYNDVYHFYGVDIEK